MKMKYVTVKSGLESVDGAYLGQFVSNGTRFLDDIAVAMCVDRPAVDEPEARLAIRALAAEIREQVGEKLCRVNAGAVSFEPAISGSLPAMDAPLSEENELYVSIIASDFLKNAIGALVPTRDSSSAINVVIDNVEDLASHDRAIAGTREFVVTGYNLSARLEGEGLSLAEDDGTPAAAVTVKAEDGMGQRINAQLAAAVPAGDYRLQLTTHGYSTPDADVETYTKKVKVEDDSAPGPVVVDTPRIDAVQSTEAGAQSGVIKVDEYPQLLGEHLALDEDDEVHIFAVSSAEGGEETEIAVVLATGLRQNSDRVLTLDNKDLDLHSGQRYAFVVEKTVTVGGEARTVRSNKVYANTIA